MAYTYGRDGDDVVLNQSGSPVVSTSLAIYASEADAKAGANQVGSAQVSNGRWAFTSDLTTIWVVAPGGGDPWQVKSSIGTKGDPGPATSLSIGSVTSGSTASAAIRGTAPSQTLDLVLPKGADGAPGKDGAAGKDGATGPANTLSIGNVAAGAQAAAAIRGTAPNQVLDLPLPKGADAATPSLSIGTVQTGPQAAASITGTAPNQVLNLTMVDPAKYELRGSGMPEGVVAAPPSTYYTDEAQTDGAIRWVKKTGTGTTGWVVIMADTGWLNITPATLPTTLTSGRLEIRRVGPTVMFRVVSLVFASGQTGPVNLLPSGVSLGSGAFTPAASYRPIFFAVDTDVIEAHMLMPYVVGPSLYLRYMGRMQGIATAGVYQDVKPSKGVNGFVSWDTANAWPATLPTPGA